MNELTKHIKIGKIKRAHKLAKSQLKEIAFMCDFKWAVVGSS
jgi:hypothetical protein